MMLNYFYATRIGECKHHLPDGQIPVLVSDSPQPLLLDVSVAAYEPYRCGTRLTHHLTSRSNANQALALSTEIEH